jgi:MtrB/PioB family decaheme-associated outer membrane protein
LDTRELSFSHEKQGDWKYGLDYSSTVKRDIRTVNSGMSGAGSSTPTLVNLATPGSGNDLNFDIKRTSLGLSLGKWFTENLQFEASYKHEDKDGTRIFGKGFACTSGAAPGCAGAGSPATLASYAALLVPEPINSTTHQMEAKLSYATEKLSLSGGYYGSIYDNGLSALTPSVPGSLNNPLGINASLSAGLQNILNLPMALPPDNQAHQFYLSGNYVFTPTTRLNFKYAYTHSTQDADFSNAFAAPAGVKNLGGEMNTQLAQVGLTARPLSKLTLSAKLRYEDKNDQTPLRLYNIEGTNTFTNNRNSITRLGGKFEGSYLLPANYRMTLGVDYDEIRRSLPVSSTEVAGLSALRAETKETGYRLELHKTLNETLTGSIGYFNSKRDGSDWFSLSSLDPNNLNSNATTAAAQLALINKYCGGVACYGQIIPTSAILGTSYPTPTATNAAGVYNSTAILPSMLMDRQREKWRLAADWSPTERLSLQFMFEDGTDKNDVPGAVRGLQNSDLTFANIDAMFSVSDRLKLTAFASHGKQSTFINHSTGYALELKNTNDTYGIGLRSKATGKLDLGADLTFSDDVTRYKQGADASILTSANLTTLSTLGQLPDVKFTQTTLRMFGNYEIDKKSAVRVDLVHVLSKLKDWTWENSGTYFVYGDNTTVELKPKQTVSFLGVRYLYKFQ